MNTKSDIGKGRGRPKGNKVAICRRVPPELVEKMDGYLDAAIKGLRDNGNKAMAEYFKKAYGLDIKFDMGLLEDAAPEKKVETKPMSPIVIESVEVEALRREVAALKKKVKEYEEGNKWGA